jgi:hypothetical protein
MAAHTIDNAVGLSKEIRSGVREGGSTELRRLDPHESVKALLESI